MSEQEIEKRVVMARTVALKWIQKQAQAEYRFKVLYGAKQIKNLPNLLRSLRDGKIAMEGVQTIPDLGIKESFDSIEVWSKNRKGLKYLQDWFEKRGFETTGVW